MYALRPICCHSRFLSKFAVLVLFEFAVLSVFLLEFPECWTSVAGCSVSSVQLPLLVAVGGGDSITNILPHQRKHKVHLHQLLNCKWNKTIQQTKKIHWFSHNSKRKLFSLHFYLLMLTMDEFPAFFSTLSHSSSFPRILYLWLKSILPSVSQFVLFCFLN